MIVAIEKSCSPAELVEYYGRVDIVIEEILAHHGIKGMKWGVQKAVDKTIGTKTAGRKPSSRSGASAKSQLSDRKKKRIQGQQAKADKAQELIDKIKAKPASNLFIQTNREIQINELKKRKAVHLKAMKDIQEGHLTDFQKHAIIGGTAVAAALAAYGTFKLVDSGTAHQILDKNTFTKKNDLLTRKMSHNQLMKEVVAPINKESYATEIGRQMNCRRCTFAYEARRRGYDVEATRTLMATGQTPAGLLNATDPKSHLNTLNIGHRINARKKGPLRTMMISNEGLGRRAVDPAFLSLDKTEKAQSIFDTIASHGPGARGELGVNWSFGGAHSLAWENIGGKPVIFDAQTGDSYRSVEEVADRLTGHVRNAGITRLDNIDLNTDFLKRWVTNVE